MKDEHGAVIKEITGAKHGAFIEEIPEPICYSIRGTRKQNDRLGGFKGTPSGLSYGVYLEHPLCVYCNVVPVELHPLLHTLPYPYLLVPRDTITGWQASLILSMSPLLLLTRKPKLTTTNSLLT
jgi:hypothetical protein